MCPRRSRPWLHDAQTSGGLLLAQPTGTTGLLEDLRALGLPAVVIGRAVEGPAVG